jgi:hypothetical protein
MGLIRLVDLIRRDQIIAGNNVQIVRRDARGTWLKSLAGIIGACCSSDGNSCSEVPKSQCGGVWVGPGTKCADQNCSDIALACGEAPNRPNFISARFSWNILCAHEICNCQAASCAGGPYTGSTYFVYNLFGTKSCILSTSGLELVQWDFSLCDYASCTGGPPPFPGYYGGISGCAVYWPQGGSQWYLNVVVLALQCWPPSSGSVCCLGYLNYLNLTAPPSPMPQSSALGIKPQGSYHFSDPTINLSVDVVIG